MRQIQNRDVDIEKKLKRLMQYEFQRTKVLDYNHV